MKIKKHGMMDSAFVGERTLKASKSGYGNLEEIIERCQESDPSLDYDYLVKVVQEQIDLVGDNGVIVMPGRSGFFQTDVEQLSADDAALVSAKIKSSSPTDELCVSENILLKLANFWQKPGDEETYVPADIFWANTIPIHDCIIRNPYNEALLKQRNEQSVDYCRITIFDEPETVKGHACGAVILYYKTGNVFFTVFGLGDPDEDMETANKIVISQAVGLLKTEDLRFKQSFYKNPYLFKSNADGLFETMFSYLRVWYGIQVSLLNPAIKEVFTEHANPKHTIAETTKDRKGKTKTKIRYVKKITITEDVFEECLKRSYIRKKMCWYVTGHWRNQATKEGHKRIFIQGYWKGVARESKKSDTREREIVFEEDNGNPDFTE